MIRYTVRCMRPDEQLRLRGLEDFWLDPPILRDGAFGSLKAPVLMTLGEAQEVLRLARQFHPKARFQLYTIELTRGVAPK